MPIYEVEHVFPMSAQQQAQLAESITSVHSNTFTTPRLFVNVRFTDTSVHATFVGGKPQRSNRIIGYVRHGASRPKEKYDELCANLQHAWTTVIGGSQELRAIFVLGEILAATEAGLTLPSAGGDQQWVKDNLDEFRRRADAGDQDFKDLLVDLDERPELGAKK